MALHAEAKQKDLPVSDLRVTCYGIQESEVRDPDGHILWSGLVRSANLRVANERLIPMTDTSEARHAVVRRGIEF
jgi:hypothetical protein